MGLQWCLTEAPKLEKMLLDSVESSRPLDIDSFPVALRDIARESLIDPQQMRYLRQLLLFCYKASVPHDIKTTEKAYQGFLDTNRAVGYFSNSLSESSPLYLDGARRHCQSVLYRFRERAIKPSHGPGAVTTSKEVWRKIYSQIEYIYPFSDWFALSQNREHLADWETADRDDVISARFVAVPKDTRGPRLICVHPAEAIWIQQGLRRELERTISLYRYNQPGPWPRGRIQFDNQSNNGSIALHSSLSRRYATLDMKEASDRISESLVQILFGDKYKFFGCCRAQKYVIRPFGGFPLRTGDLHCYAPMGNATTFPVQSLVFWSICVAALQYHGLHQPGAVFVFGDDIIVKTEVAEIVINALESFGLLVNRTKSFYRGAFRESCGIDAFNGVNVTPVRWKTTIDAEHCTGLQSLSDIAMRLRVAGYEEAAAMTYRTLRERLASRYGKRLFLTNNPSHGGIAEFSRNEAAVWGDAYWHRSIQWFSSRVWRLESTPRKRDRSGWNHVLESVCSLELSGHSSVPSRSALRRVRLNRGWIGIR